MNQKQANRAQRRKDDRENRKPKSLRGTSQQIQARMAKNGITAEDLEANYWLGVEDGKKAGIVMVYKIVYAAIMLTLREQLKFGHARALRFIQRVDDFVTSDILSSQDAIDRVWDEVGVKMNFNDAFDRIEEANHGTQA